MMPMSLPMWLLKLENVVTALRIARLASTMATNHAHNVQTSASAFNNYAFEYSAAISMAANAAVNIAAINAIAALNDALLAAIKADADTAGNVDATLNAEKVAANSFVAASKNVAKAVVAAYCDAAKSACDTAAEAAKKAGATEVGVIATSSAVAVATAIASGMSKKDIGAAGTDAAMAAEKLAVSKKEERYQAQVKLGTKVEWWVSWIMILGALAINLSIIGIAGFNKAEHTAKFLLSSFAVGISVPAGGTLLSKMIEIYLSQADKNIPVGL